MFKIFKKTETIDEIIVYSPITGTVKPLSKVKDQVFSQKMVGDGCAVVPTNGIVKSPLKGNVKVAFPTGHAFGIEGKNGIEILIHIGIDTVDLNGKGFTKKVEQNSKVSLDDVLCEFDLKFLNSKAKSSDVMVIATSDSSEEYKVEMIATNKVTVGDELFKLVKK